MDNAQIIFYPKTDKSFIIKKGTPLVQVIPFRREEWSSSVQIKDPQTYIDNLSDITSPYHESDAVSLHIKYSEKNDEERKQRENPRKSVQAAINEANLLEDAGLGPYRKIGMHIPKVKLFSKKDNQLEIPKECPMHGKTKEEIQLEMNFGDDDGS